jgi:methyl-accepting chemotaxis protein
MPYHHETHATSTSSHSGGTLLDGLSVRAKLRLLSLPGIIAALLLTGWHAAETYNQGYRAHANTTQSAVEAATSVLQWAYAQETRGALTREQAQRAAIEAVRTLRYAGTEYFCISDMHPTVVMHPIKPALNGKDATGIKDPNGMALFVAFADTVRAHGSGFVSYLWPKAAARSERPSTPNVSVQSDFARPTRRREEEMVGV